MNTRKITLRQKEIYYSKYSSICPHTVGGGMPPIGAGLPLPTVGSIAGAIIEVPNLILSIGKSIRGLISIPLVSVRTARLFWRWVW